MGTIDRDDRRLNDVSVQYTSNTGLRRRDVSIQGTINYGRDVSIQGTL